ncbi:MAG: antibiotic biosynthesis monooxygenase [Acidobacteriota bacterium]|nr:antibiotic biosynthesis monooxygenase [Acidobacteriota bacterium]MDH3528528.1 antibiotic biosynthesis monooxygenase [Acidobacteriota bacterium]
MANMLIRHRVDDYDAWKKVFDEFIDTRRAAGEKSWRIWRTDDDANNLVLLFGWDTIENAKAFFASAELKATMENAGVAEPPEVYFLEEVNRGKTAAA